jgi:uncharacterized protein (DUF1778 family)
MVEVGQWRSRHASGTSGCRCARRAEQRKLIKDAAAASGVDATTFILSNAVLGAARRVLADRNRFVLDPDALAVWEAVDDRPARELPGLAKLMRRQSSFTG